MIILIKFHLRAVSSRLNKGVKTKRKIKKSRSARLVDTLKRWTSLFLRELSWGQVPLTIVCTRK